MKTGFNIEYAKNFLTTDIDCKDSLFDLIDNSIDAAREALQKANPLSAHGFVQEDFGGFEVSLGISGKEIWLEDNCSGIDQNEMESRLLVIGEAPGKPKAIGQFGAGLKRALLKLGTEYEITTNNNGKTYVMGFSAKDLTSSIDSIEAKYVKHSDRPFTRVTIRHLSKAADMEISMNSAWGSEFSRELGIRYHLFLKKGLVIKINNVPIAGHCPTIREVANVKLQENSYTDLPGGIIVKIRAGMHSEYVLPGEPEYSEKVNEKLTQEYGWYFVCNDRVVKIACRDNKFGWSKKWHPEYYGFVGWVYFVGDAKYMPWNSKKTDIEPSSDVFSAIKDHLKLYADFYRQENRKLKKSAKGGMPKVPDSTDGHQQIGLELTNPYEDVINNQPLYIPIPDDIPNPPGEPSMEDASPGNSKPISTKPKPKKRIQASGEIIDALTNLGSQKLSQLYHSLCEIDLIQHPILASVGAWAFFETLAKKSGATVTFPAYFNSKIAEWFPDQKNDSKVYRKILNDISENGNLDKHDQDYFTIDARSLALQFERAQALILRIIHDINVTEK